MNRFIRTTMFITSFLTLAFVFARTEALAQAAAESVLLNANSATATVKAGTALGSVLNRANKQLADQVQEVSHPALGRSVPVKSQSVPTPVKGGEASQDTPPPTGALIISIHGSAINGSANPSCVAMPPSPSTPAKTTPSANTNCANRSDSKPAPQKYKSVLTVSFPK